MISFGQGEGMSGKSMVDHQRSLRSFRLGYMLALCATALLCVLAAVIQESYTNRQIQDGEVINVSGRQRAISERVAANASLAVDLRELSSVRQSAIQTLRQSMAKWEDDHRKLVELSQRDGAKELQSAIQLASIPKLRLESSIREIISSDGRVHKPINEVRADQKEFFSKQEQVLQELQKHVLLKVERNSLVQKIAAGCLILALFLQGVLLFRPLMNRVVESVTQLEDQNDELESLQAEMEAQHETLQEQQASLAQALSRSDDMTRVSRFAAARFEELFAGLPIAACTFDNSGSIFEWNREAEALFGISSAKALGASLTEIVATSENQADYRSLVEGVFGGSHLYNIEQRMIRANGEERIAVINAFPLRDPEGRITGGVCSMADVTEQRVAEEQVKKSESRFRVLFEHSTDPHLLFDDSGIVDCNNAAVTLLKCDCREQLLATHPARFSPELQPDGQRSEVKCIEMDGFAYSKGHHRFEWTHRTMDGTDFPVEVSLTAVTVGEKPTLLVVWHDLTEQKKHEAKMTLATETLERAQAIARIGSWECDANLNTLSWSDEMYRIVGLSPSAPPLSGPEFFSLVHIDDAGLLVEVIQGAVSQKISWETEHRFSRLDGEERIVLCTGHPIEEGQKYVGTLQDVTETRAEARRIQESESLFRTSMDSLHTGVAFMNDAGKITMVNPKGAQILGLTVDQVLGESPIDPRWGNLNEDGTDLAIEDTPLVRAFQTGEPVEAFVHGVRMPDGGITWISVNSSPVLLEGQANPIGAVASFTDISQLRQQQEMLMVQMVQTNEQAVTLELQKMDLEMMNEKLEKLATTDGLTGLNNHRHFQDFLRQKFVEVSRSKGPLSLLLLDVDKFKTFNDEFGHQAGDEVLKGVARALESAARESDFVARYGGEEYVIVLPDTDRIGAMEAAERFRMVIEACEWPYRRVTASFGVSTHAISTNGPEQMIAEADVALYESKRTGRNRSTHANSLSSSSIPS